MITAPATTTMPMTAMATGIARLVWSPVCGVAGVTLFCAGLTSALPGLLGAAGSFAMGSALVWVSKASFSKVAV